ncbi:MULTISPECIES: hypothetical protein [unclassified Rhizobium]|uniref:hypothetical protein n=1 Tax=unclassified Rhizobium TaxID=2613769 RepID=UPI0006FAA3B0|nr:MULTISPECIES: hypothetical protein [unclassified Rhizobium]KQV39171.1 hypothetical protein ASC86_23170 [Rhizobium sp. Root1212]KRD35145.1 hypothetical protein ASE37_21740 [Rhizobium sp. Root268]
MKKQNPAAREGANRVPEIAAITKPLDIKNPTEIHPEIQSEMLAVRSVMRRCCVSFYHAKAICQLSGLGGYAA